MDLRAADFAAQARRVVNGAGPADEVLELVAELGDERVVALVALVRGLQFFQRVDQRLGDETAAIWPEVPARVGLLVVLHGVIRPAPSRPKPDCAPSGGQRRREA